ncbi:MAG: hypothetical protein F4213_13295 [Boseongicola sp. SB0677_bin_26]|nr:hypothetical protein [Boseongicola sp. SB0677_bin_26]
MNETATARAVRRRRPPNRRFSETRKLVWSGRTIFVTVGYGRDGLEPSEIFYSAGYSSGSDMEVLVSDLCIALSVMVQHEGVTAATLGRSMGETFDLRTGDPMPASILGLLIEELSRPPEWADAMAQAEAAEAATGEETELSPAGALDRPSSGEAGRPDNPGPEGAARQQPEGHARDGATSGAKDA